MQSRLVLLFIAFLTFALLVASSPVPVNEDALVKKALKQYNAKRSEGKRDDGHFIPKPKPKPSKIWRAAEAAPTAAVKRN
ncbi:hypothetical protein A0H81_04857 [Grifola frondosa]|uniref:Uncharacterized protein n=1 Tax=Grifola frondosa TaxID=5627 RepID=A0A1C7MDV3_GRIFR|nr:hypothetical protein A0H81_04857 [Grifola frondosa]